MKDILEKYNQLNDTWQSLRGHFDVPKKLDLLKGLENESVREGFWNDQDKAKKTMAEVDDLKSKKADWDSVETHLSDAKTLYDLSIEAGDTSSESEINSYLNLVKSDLARIEFQKMLSGPQDKSSAFFQINAGAGGTESCDWVSILLRMYLRFCEKKGYKTEMIDFTEGDGAGYRSVTVFVSGLYAYCHLKAEVGVHRLVRISPFDANSRRHTSFASVFVYPDVEDDIDIEVKEADLRIDTYRAGGAGGQKVNKTDSAVRMTHLPTGIVVQCQNERSQHQNRAVAMKMLKAKLYELEMEKRRAEQAVVEANKKDIAWGSQIRSYVLHPYQMIKDHRTDFETSDSQGVLDGELDGFIRDYLLKSC
ncbi:peptide chain release factor 2 [bacterium]|nr:peptide chain release factor 2 [bacterium]